ncbi:MAG: hypothetical protein RL198_197 [Actinomycetota bacterium]
MGPASGRVIDLDISGMTCTACAARVERALNELPGVSASVDFATERATVSIPEDSPLNREQIGKAVARAGYAASSRSPETALLRARLYLGALLALPVALLGMIPALHFAGQQYFALALTLPIVLWVAWPFHSATAKNLKRGTVTMDTLITLGSVSALGYSIWLVIAGEHHNFLEVAAVVPVAVLFGKWLELKTRRSATDAVRALLAGLPEQVWIVGPDGNRRQVPIDEVRPGDEVLVAAGERVPVDGQLLSLSASFDMAHLSGEALPVELVESQAVPAGAINCGGEVRIRASRPANESRVARIAQLVREASAQKTQVKHLVDRISAVFVPVVIVIALLTLIGWLTLASNTEIAVGSALAVLVVACPCALGIAIPMSMAVASGIGSKRGIVIRQPDALAKLRKVKTAVFDKTGTLTKGELGVVGVEVMPPLELEEVLAFAGAVAARSRHPVSVAIHRYCSGIGALADLKEARTTEEPGLGIRVADKQRTLELVRPSGREIDIVRDLTQNHSANLPHITVFKLDGRVAAYFLLEDKTRNQARQAIEHLGQLGITPVLLSGDIEQRVASLAEELSIEEWYSEATPEEKLAKVRELQEKSPVLMVGDGLNDTAVLAAADVGIAMGSGSHAAQSAAQITVLDDNPESIPYAVRLGRATWANMVQNLGWAFGYNLTLIPLAAFGLLEPMFAGIAMALSSVSVVVNAKRLEWGSGSNGARPLKPNERDGGRA